MSAENRVITAGDRDDMVPRNQVRRLQLPSVVNICWIYWQSSVMGNETFCICYFGLTSYEIFRFFEGRFSCLYENLKSVSSATCYSRHDDDDTQAVVSAPKC